MRPHYISIFLILSTLLQHQSTCCSKSRLPEFRGEEEEEQNRRVLHQPLFPASSSPPPPPPVLQPPPSTPDQDQPFFHEIPNEPSGGQGQQSPPPPATNAGEVSNPVAVTKSSSKIKEVAITIASVILALAVLFVLALYAYKRCGRSQDESQKLVGGNSQRINEESRMPPSTFLYIGTVEPSGRSLADESNAANGSPYRKLNSGRRSDRYRPSPDLQPLPPLTKPPPTPTISSPPPMSSSDDESHDTNFYTPQGSTVSNESPGSRSSYLNNIISQLNQTRPDNRVSSSIPHSKRTSPKSRVSGSSPDTKAVIIPPSVKQPVPPSPPPPPMPLPPTKTLSYTPKKPKFSKPPPPLDIARLRSISSEDQHQETSKVQISPPTPPPPPPPPPPAPPRPPPPPQLSIPRKVGALKADTPFATPKEMISPGESISPNTNSLSPTVEVDKSPNSSEKVDGEEKDGSRPKLKPLHWDKVRATSDRATVWDQLQSSSFQLNEDAMESLFGCNSANSVPKEASRKQVLPSLKQENRVLDPKKSQNIAILLRALNVTKDEVSEALLDGNPDGLGLELLETLVKMAPTKEEEIKLKDYNGDSSKLGTAERFLKAILDVPFAFRRVEAMLYRANFETEVKYLRTAFQTLEEASEELKNSRLFLKLLEAVLRTGNRMNDGTNRGDARAFKLDTLLKLVDVKGTDGKTTLLHFVVQEIIRSEGTDSDATSESLPNKSEFKFKEEEFKKQGLQVVSGLSKELGNVKKAAGMDSDVLSSYVSKLEMGMEKVRLVMQYERQSTQGKFFDSMREFLKQAVDEISRIKAEEKKALSLVKEVTQYFHGDAAKEEAHPLRIFMIVRDFLSILDNVCKDVGRMQERATVGTGRSFRMPVNASLPVLNRYNTRHDDDSM